MTEQDDLKKQSSQSAGTITASKSSLHNGVILALFALLTTGLTSLTWLITKERIEYEKEKALLKAITALVPAEKYANDPYRDCTLMLDSTLLGSKKQLPVWRLRDTDGKPVAALISSVAPDGYNGAIEIIVGHYYNELAQERPSSEQSDPSDNYLLAGVRVTTHNETPGLGDKIDTKKSPWILQFTNLDTSKFAIKDWRVKKDGGTFDAFTGATITPRALLKAIGKNTHYFNLHKSEIFSAPSNCLIDNEEMIDG